MNWKNILTVGTLALVLISGGNNTTLATEPARGDTTVGPEGLHTQSWFIQSFLELKDDLKEASAAGKRLAIIWEQRGCPYCRDTHLVNFAQPEIRDYIKANFNVIQLNKNGLREVTDFDGQTLNEKSLAAKYRIVFTPTIQFFPPRAEDILKRPKAAPEAVRMTGYYQPFHFLAMFHYVHDGAYGKESFRKYLKSFTAARQRTGAKTSFD